ncbi:helix-turn-helix transcriptional regulator [Streptomyces sp. NPDC021098]|uniref:helix-turn-helix transcriptional regulator n=1 Tax=unclassified Streptomyces TaxID=2593676 RepID=UPI0037BC3F3B
MADTLGGFLRARREQLSPEQAGLPAGVRRRVPGLRREEVAYLAGISPEYYLRLEQGRNQHPSDEILDSLASALQLDDDAIVYLHRLAHPAPAARRRRPRRQGSDATLQPLLDGWPLTPAYAQGPDGRVVAANPLAVALCPFFAVGHNPLRAAFLEPEMRSLYPQWDDMTAKAVSGLRAVLSLDDADPDLLATIGELTVASQRFRTLWAKRDVRRRATGHTRFDHPQVGTLDLRYEKLLRPEAQQLLVIYHADPGSPSAEGLQLLAGLTSGRDGAVD